MGNAISGPDVARAITKSHRISDAPAASADEFAGICCHSR
jgi:hypothetical protein